MPGELKAWIGASGRKYNYWIYRLPAALKPGQFGNYIFAKTVDHKWVPLYVGQGDIGERLDGHHQAACIRAKGATHLHVHKNVDERSRIAEVRDLLGGYPQAYTPNGCNVRSGG